MKDKIGFFGHMIYLEKIESTNTYLKENESDDRTIVYTFDQTKGRGRDNRDWIDFKDKNLALSMILKPEKPVNPVWFVAAVSLSVIELLKNTGVRKSWIKWPNDIYVEDKKISGILAESSWSDGNLKKIIIGVGVNINSAAGDLERIGRKATSIQIESGCVIDMNDTAEKLVSIMGKYFSMLFSAGGVQKIKRLWIRNSKFTGMKAVWTTGDKKICGMVKKISDDGTIILKSGKKLHNIISGDVEILY